MQHSFGRTANRVIYTVSYVDLGWGSVRRTTIAAVAAVMGLLGGCGFTSSRGGGQVQVSGTPAAVPDQPLAELDRQGFEDVLAGFTGRGIVVNVWASWCAPCQVEAPLLRRAHEAAGASVAFIGVATRDQPRPAAEFIDRYGISYPNITDSSGAITRWLGGRGLPTTVIFDATGRRKAIITGALSEQVLVGHLAELTP